MVSKMLKRLECNESLLETLKESCSVQAVDQSVMYFNRYRHDPTSAILRATAENDSRNGLFTPPHGICECGETYPRKRRMINQIVLRFRGRPHQLAGPGSLRFGAGYALEIRERLRHRKDGER